MKKMRILFALMFCLLQATALLAQQKYTVHGKIELLSGSKNIHLGNHIIPIQSDGTFEFSGEVPVPSETYMGTDSSFRISIWLEEGNYILNCSEYRNPADKSTLFKASLTGGPKEATIYDHFQQQIYKGFIDNSPREDKSQVRNRQQTAATKYMDSIFSHYPNLKCLSLMVNEVYHFAGDQATKKFISMLTPEMRNSYAIKGIQNELNRQDKIDKEMFFEDFTMQTADGKPFKLSSLKTKKVILIDFWASTCAPCRAEHPAFIELYKKYANKGLEIVSISLDDKTDAWLKAMKQDSINTWINVSELKGWKSELVNDYYLDYIPIRFMLNGDRKIIQVYPMGQMPSEKDITTNL